MMTDPSVVTGAGGSFGVLSSFAGVAGLSSFAGALSSFGAVGLSSFFGSSFFGSSFLGVVLSSFGCVLSSFTAGFSSFIGSSFLAGAGSVFGGGVGWARAGDSPGRGQEDGEEHEATCGHGWQPGGGEGERREDWGILNFHPRMVKRPRGNRPPAGILKATSTPTTEAAMPVHLPTGRDRDEWQLAVWNADDAVLTRPQKLVFMLMLEASFNQFDAFRVVGDLLRYRDLWEGVVMCRGFPMARTPNDQYLHLHGDLIGLRDVARGYWNVDTVYILHRHENTSALTDLTKTWQADEVDNYTGDQSGSLLGAYGLDQPVLRVWWD